MAARNIRLALSDYAPPEVLTASPAARRAFLERFGELALHLKRRMVVRGISPEGKRFPKRKRPRPDGANGAPLAPHGQESRSARLLAVHVGDDFITLFWRGHGRKSWAKILGYHADGEVRGAPVRNEFDLDEKTKRQIKATMKTWWGVREKEKPKPPTPPTVVEKPKPKPPVKPPAPRPIAAKPLTTTTIPAKGRKPRSNTVQVYETPGRKPPKPPTPKPRPPAPKPRPMVAKPPPQPRPMVAASPPAPPPPFAPPLLPGRPIAERLAAYDEGQKRVEAIAQLHYDVHAAEQARYAQAREMQRLEREVWPLTGKARKAAEAEHYRAALLFDTKKAAHIEAATRAREEAIKHLKPPVTSHLHVEPGTIEALNAQQEGSARRGIDFVQRVAGLPSDVKPVNFQQTASDRAFCTRERIALPANADPQTVAHEIGHHLDNHVPGFNQSAREFLAYRVGDEPRVKLNDVTKRSFDANEFGRKDKFEDAFGDRAYYVGKDYDDGFTEITAMGLGELYSDPVGFAKKDPEYVKFLIGLLHGVLR